jgi:hypothetical protein
VIPTPDLSSAVTALETLRGRVDDQKIEAIKSAMQALQAALAKSDWAAAQQAGLALQAAWKPVMGELIPHEAVADPQGFVERHRATVEAASETSGPEIVT